MQTATSQRIRADGALEAVAPSDIAPGDLIALAPGERAPVDGEVEEGISELDRAILTGETDPIAVRPGDALQAGVLNLTRTLRLRAKRRATDSTLSDLARLIELGEQKRAQRMRLIDRAAALYVPLVHGLALAVFIGWIAAAGDFRLALTNAIAILIITCPCALGLAAPAVQVVATGRLFLEGVFIKSGDALERLAEIDTVVLDKTGVLTLGKPQLKGPVEPFLLHMAAQLARASRHPLSRALANAAGVGPIASHVAEFPGLGLKGEIEGRTARLGSRVFVAPHQRVPSHTLAELWFQIGDSDPVPFFFEDVLRKDAAAAIAKLRARGLSVELLSGDRPTPVAAAAHEAGIDQWRASVSPSEKAARLAELAAAGKKALMIGDGLNDAAALAGAFISAAPGAAIDVSQTASDLVFQSQELSPIVDAIDVARASRSRVMENIWFSALYNVIAIPFAAFGFITPLIAAVAMSSSSLLVTLNALRLAKGRLWTS
jgi:Cu2+-exporting ATPase